MDRIKTKERGLGCVSVNPLKFSLFLLWLTFAMFSSQITLATSHETLVEEICGWRLAGDALADPNGDGLEAELASRVTCPNQVGNIDLTVNEFGGIAPVDISGVYTQSVPGDYAWIESGQVTLTLEYLGVEPHVNILLHKYSGTVVFENFSWPRWNSKRGCQYLAKIFVFGNSAQIRRRSKVGNLKKLTY